MKFRLTADFTFTAKNIDDAMEKLSEHFKNPLESEMLSDGLINVSDMDINVSEKDLRWQLITVEP